MQSPFVLADGGIETRIAYETDIPLDDEMGVSRLVDDDRGRAALGAVYRQYLGVGRRHDVPMQIGTPTFHASPERLHRSGLTGPDDLRRVNGQWVGMLLRLRDECGGYGEKVFVAGVIGPKGDAYRPEEALGEGEAAGYHRGQVEALAGAGVNLLYAPTFPAATEAAGVARAMAGTGLPYMVSFVITGRGALLDGTPLADVIDRIDGAVSPRPVCYSVNCVHPSVVREALRGTERLRRLAGVRLLGFKANTSRKSPAERLVLDRLDTVAPEAFADEMMGLQDEFALRLLGGCCGTDHSHIGCLAERLTAGRP
jgi:homocysteine S-methyltransferase